MSITDEWLMRLDLADRELLDPVAAIDALEAMEALHSRPTLGWVERNTRQRTDP